MHRRAVLSTLALAATAGVLAAAPADAATASVFPARIPLPDGFGPEGIAIRGTTFYTASMRDGAVYRGDVLTGEGAVLVPGTPGGNASGIHVDDHGRLWVCGGSTGGASVLDPRTGATLAHYQLTTDLDHTNVNDLVITRDAVYLTDTGSGRYHLYAIPLGPGGRLPGPDGFRGMTLTGPAGETHATNNGIVALPDGRLIVVQMVPGTLSLVDPWTGSSTLIDVGDLTFPRGDGLLLCGRTLYICQNKGQNKISVLHLDATFTRGVLTKVIVDPRFDTPATMAPFGPYLYVTNGRFTTVPTPTTPYDIVRVAA